jgi:uncharacterized membrane protein
MPVIVWWIVHALIAVLLFFLVEWLLPLVLGLIGIAIPANIVTILALLVALCYLIGAYQGNWWRRPVP